MEDWLEAGRRIKAEWAAMLEAMRTRSEKKVKLPFVPLRVSGGALRAAVDELSALTYKMTEALYAELGGDESE